METIPVTGAPVKRQVIFDTDPSPDDAVAFLAAVESSFVTAQVLTVDGGRMDYIGHP